MSYDIMSQFYTCLNFPLQEKLIELTRIIDQSSPNKDLQTLMPQLISNIFASNFSNGWGLGTITYDSNRYEFELLISFLEPQGPLFRLCYKLLADPQLKYNLPLNILPLDLQMILEKGRYAQFYADMLTVDPHSLKVVALALNPFDYYIFNFSLYLVNNSYNKSTWENWNSVYFALACDYLMHFLPSDPNVPVLPHIPNYTGKVSIAAPLQTANRPLCSSSLLLLPDLSGISNQHTSPQTQSRNEVWRSETVLQVFIDIWMSVEPFSSRNIDMFNRNYSHTSSPERVRTVRVLVKHLHSFSAKYLSDPVGRSSALRKYARQIICARAYHYIKHLVKTWPLDASFRLVMELWLSFIQPWRYTDNTINQDRFPGSNNNQEEVYTGALDPSFTQFISENFPTYTCIFQLILPRFMRLDLTAYKNAVMLFRLGKVFSQQPLVPILRELEHAITANNSEYHNPDTSHNNSLDQNFTYNGGVLHKWVAVAKQAISEFNISTDFIYEPIWNENSKQLQIEFVKKIMSSKGTAEKIVDEFSEKVRKQHQGIWSSITHFFMMGNKDEDELSLEECKKVPNYLNNCVHYFTNIFGLNEYSLFRLEPVVEETLLEHSSFANTSGLPYSITDKLRSKSTNIHYMGDPDIMPIASYESTILVRILYQVASKLNETYSEEFSRVWNKNDFWGLIAHEILQKPCVIQTYVKDTTNHNYIVRQELPARLSLRRFGSHAFIFWATVGYVIFKLLSFSGFFYIFCLVTMWMLFVLTTAFLKKLSIIKT